MGVYIKGMEMPESCFQCWFLHVINPGYFYCFASGEELEENFATPKGRYKDCPLVEVPTPHGRLIDADDALDTMSYKMCGTGYQSEATSVLRYESITPTALEAEG